ncbi:aminoacyl-tRNA hydrolase [Sporichthya polymorpha]|uniref:aminoacyl-tRNA hydrolase n=1 Tax=Sporichthya polymorpha TaxID=35751 RepID=UPI00035E514E|nr:aminoacyl-tRNA hydrolase [Sporichthya polymorpha]
MSEDRWLVVGLGNPGPEYVANRHNIGFLVVETLAERARSSFKVHKARADVAEIRLGGPGGPPVVLARPRSYMNESGGPVSGLCKYYDVPAERLVVIHDELDLPFAALRAKFGGGDNGHNGLKSLRRSLGTGDYHRIRFGIDRPPGRMDPAAYVLRDFSAAERKDLDLEIDRCADAVEMLVREGLERTQNTFNS